MPLVQNTQQNIAPHVQSGQQHIAPMVQNVQQNSVPLVQPLGHVQAAHSGVQNNQQGNLLHQQNNNVLVGNSNQIQALNSSQYKSNNQVSSSFFLKSTRIVVSGITFYLSPQLFLILVKTAPLCYVVVGDRSFTQPITVNLSGSSADGDPFV